MRYDWGCCDEGYDHGVWLLASVSVTNPNHPPPVPRNLCASYGVSKDGVSLEIQRARRVVTAFPGGAMRKTIQSTFRSSVYLKLYDVGRP